MLDTNGKPVMVPGSVYLTPGQNLLSDLHSTAAQMHYDKASIALAAHDTGDYYYQMRLAGTAEDASNRVRARRKRAIAGDLEP